MRPLEFGWYLPTHGDTTAYGLPEAQVGGSPELCERVVRAAEQAGFEYLLIPVGSTCWEAWIAGAFMAARSSKIKPLIAARPGYINPVLLAKMISTFDQMSGGRICVNLIAGQNESEVEAEGIRYPKEERYALMEEEVSILKALWTSHGPVHFKGRFHTLSGAHIRPRPLQQPYPKFYLGGGSRQAWEMSAKHSDVHLFWGDLPERIAANIGEIR
jgi:alkanesulfonate monooxygenase